MPLDDAKPFPKSQQLARGERRRTRQVASKRRWAEIAERKQGPCRCCLAAPPNQLHHLISRSQGGSDTEANIVALCLHCHAKVEARNRDYCRLLAESLRDAEYAYVIHHYGEAFFERRLGVRYERA